MLVFGAAVRLRRRASSPSWVDAAASPTSPSTTFVLRAFLAVVVGGATLAAAYLALNPPDVDAVPGGRATAAAHRFEWLVPVLLVDAVFAVFLAAQAAVLFGGHDYLQRTTGLTYAEYVHQGFGQLTVATAAHPARRLGRLPQGAGDDAGDRLLAARLARPALRCSPWWWSVSALYRMHALPGGLRLHPAPPAGRRLRGLARRRRAGRGSSPASSRWGAWLPRFALITGVVALLGLAAINPDAWIAAPQHRPVRGDRQDRLDFLATSPTTPSRCSRPLPRAAADARRWAAGDAADDDWLAWNLGRWRAAEYLVVE